VRTVTWLLSVGFFLYLLRDAHGKPWGYKFLVLFSFWWAVLYLID